MTTFLGVDGGGLKTAFCLVTDDGRIAAEVQSRSTSGGVFTAPRVRDDFARILARSTRSYDLREPFYPPAVGSALCAARLTGTPLERSARERLLAAARVADV